LVKVKGEDAEVASGLFTIGEESESEEKDAEDSGSHSVMILILVALIFGILITLTGVLKYKPPKTPTGYSNSKKEDSP